MRPSRSIRLCLAGLALGHSALAPWAPAPGLGDGAVNRLVPYGSRLCAATGNGIYCTDRDRAEWRPAFLEGKRILDLAKTRSGWAAIAEEPDPGSADTLASYPPAKKAYYSWDEGATWSKSDTLPLVNRDGATLQAYGDSLLRWDGSYLSLTENGGRTWRRLSPSPPGYLAGCTPVAQALMCVDGAGALRIYGPGPDAAWREAAAFRASDPFYFHAGRLYAQDSRGVIRVYGPAGPERVLPALPGFKIALVSDSLIVAQSVAQSPLEYAFLRNPDSAWMRVTAPTEPPQIIAGGVWSGNEGIVLSGSGVPLQAKLAGAEAIFDPFSEGLGNPMIRALLPDGPGIQVATSEGVWRKNAAGGWKRLFHDGEGIGAFWNFASLEMVSSDASPSQSWFSLDSGRSWQAARPSPPGRVTGLVRFGAGFLALAESAAVDSIGNIARRTYGLYELRKAKGGSWSLRTEYGAMGWAQELAVCGSRLFMSRPYGVYASEDTGKTWMPTGYAEVFPAEGSHLYARDSGMGLWESRRCGEKWTGVPMPWSGGGTAGAVNPAGEQPLVSRYEDRKGESRVYALSGASPDWAGIESFPLPGRVRALLLHAGILYAATEARGLYAMDAPASGIRPVGPSRRPAPHRFPGWRRIDGRALGGGALPAHIPLFPAASAR